MGNGRKTREKCRNSSAGVWRAILPPLLSADMSPRLSLDCSARREKTTDLTPPDPPRLPSPDALEVSYILQAKKQPLHARSLLCDPGGGIPGPPGNRRALLAQHRRCENHRSRQCQWLRATSGGLHGGPARDATTFDISASTTGFSPGWREMHFSKSLRASSSRRISR